MWEGEPGDQRQISYQELHRLVCRFANVLKGRGLKAGDRAIIYMGMVPELPVALLACARLGIIHSVVFGGFSAEALKTRIQDLQAQVVITADGAWRRGKEVRLKPAVDESLTDCPSVRDVIVLRTFQGLTVNCVGDDGLILAGKIFVKQINHAFAADFRFVLHIKRIARSPCAAFHKLRSDFYRRFDRTLYFSL